MPTPLRVLSVYEGFFRGGARILHTSVITSLAREYRQHHFVFSLHAGVTRENTVQRMEADSCYQALIAAGIPVMSLERTLGAGETPSSTFTLLELAQFQQAVNNADVILVLKEQALSIVNQVDTSGKKVVLCVHRSDPEHQGIGVDGLHQAMAAGKLDRVICNGQSATSAYLQVGIRPDIITVIKNGIDLDTFRPMPSARINLRRDLLVPHDAPVVTLAARYDGMKNVPLFLAAARQFLALQPEASFLMCGAGMTAQNPALRGDFINAFGVGPEAVPAIKLLGIRDDMPALYSASDIVALTSSYGETYCLCLIEGMACGAIPVATDVGDTAEIVAGRGILTPSDPNAIAAAWQQALMDATHFQVNIQHDRPVFDQTHMVRSYQQMIASLVGEEYAQETYPTLV